MNQASVFLVCANVVFQTFQEHFDCQCYGYALVVAQFSKYRAHCVLKAAWFLKLDTAL